MQKTPSSHHWLSAGISIIIATCFSSCVVTDYPLTQPSLTPSHSSHVSAARTTSVTRLPLELIHTTNTNWRYDPFRRAYYDTLKHRYYNHHTSNYYQTTPRRYSNRSYPYQWNQRGTCPAPRTNYRYQNNHSYRSHSTPVHNTSYKPSYKDYIRRERSRNDYQSTRRSDSRYRDHRSPQECRRTQRHLY